MTVNNTRKRLGHYFSDVVMGANDGIVTTFAIVAASQGAGLSRFIVLLMGFANLIADGFSMGASSFLAQRTKNCAIVVFIIPYSTARQFLLDL